MESEARNEVARLWRVYQTIHQLVNDRGYLVSQSELEMDLDTFKENFARTAEVDRDQLTFLVQKKDDPADQLLVFFPKDKSVGVKPIRKYVERMLTQNIPKGIIIFQQTMTSSANKVIQGMSSKYQLESFQEAELLVNITRHVLVPIHIVLSTEEKLTLLKRYRLKETQLPRIQQTDPVARYYGLKRGQVVKIMRNSETSGRYHWWGSLANQCLKVISHESPKETSLHSASILFKNPIAKSLSFVSTFAMDSFIDFSKSSLYWSLASILFNPIFWNTVARAEYRNQVLTRIAGGNPYLGCYGLAATIFSLGIIRDMIYKTALEEQPVHPLLQTEIAKHAAILLFSSGNILVLSSMWALGVTGTYLGDYFGILMSERVTSFPFNVCENPMYVGSTLTFLATALWYGRPAGVALTVIVYVAYQVALQFEGPFTTMIYENKDKDVKRRAAARTTRSSSKKEL
ncbi:hypothetical protein NQZ79_g7743 [Umbelopsis isabellina]|nr:hypothetical protein NQZ79_g7743 [Umbelopsis isabellina]